MTDFNAGNKSLTAKLLQQGYRYHKLQKTFSKFYRRHYELHYRKIKKPKRYQHFKRTGHSPDNVLVPSVEKLIYDENSSVIFKTIKRLETELKWIKLLQSASPLVFND